MSEALEALRSSVDRLRRLVEPLTPEQLAASAYPSEWSIADVLSHLGSAAVIFRRRLDSAVAGTTTPPEFSQSIWDEWNAKTVTSKAADALTADRALMARTDALSDDERTDFRFELGPMTFDFPGFVGLRLNEHALHTWDIDVALDPGATLAWDATAVVIDNLGLTARYTAKPIGNERTIVVRTSDPTRTFVIVLTADAVTVTEGGADADGDVTLPAEAFIRLVYGRLDPDHTPAGIKGADLLDELRKVFPGP